MQIEPPTSTKDGWVEGARLLLSFQNYYTTNYDLILYWLLLYLDEKKSIRHFDGFTRKKKGSPLIWADKNKQHVFYLHGCFHVFKENKQFIKYKSSLTNPIKNQVLEKLEYLQKCYTHQSTANHSISTTVVLGGNKKEKLAAIQSNKFLNYSYNTFSKLTGYLMIYGFSYGTSDEHLLDAINQSSLKRIYLGYFNKEDKQRARQWATVIDDRIRIKLFSTKGVDLSKP